MNSDDRLILQANLHEHLTQIVRCRDPFLDSEGHFYVQHYIREQWQQWGTVEPHEFRMGERIHQNLVINLPGQNPENRDSLPPILLGAHYDAVPGTPGADDNATGVAVLLELARLLTLTPTRYPVRLLAFDLEEYGLLGSKQYAADLQRQHQALRLMISLEMLGYCDARPHSQRYPHPALQYLYPDTGDFIALIGNWSTVPDLIHLSHHIRQAQVPSQWLPAGQRGLMLPAVRASDHSPFWDCGYRALMITDTAFMRNPHYHQPSDRLDTLDMEFLTGICIGLSNGIQQLQ